jgi:TonB family protein
MRALGREDVAARASVGQSERMHPRARALGGLLLAAGAANAVFALAAREAAAAPTAPSQGEKAKPVLVAPRVTKKVVPNAPVGKPAPGETIVVRVELAVSAEGKITDARVKDEGDPALDDAAVIAARQFELEPATSDGKPIAAKIEIPFTFIGAEPAPPPPPVVPTKPPPPVVAAISLKGTLRTPADEPLAGARITATYELGGKSEQVTVVSGPTGAFTFTGLPAGHARVRVEADGFAPLEVDETIETGKVREVAYTPAASDDVTDLTVKGDRPPREPTKRTIERREITRIPGTNGDGLRAIQSLPGVARPPGLAGLLIIRGSAPNDTNIFVDGTLVPLAYHFGGLSSVIPSELLEKIDFYPGNFGPEYGRVMGGIVDVGVRSPKKDGYAGLLQFDLIDGRVVAEGPIDSKTRVAVAARRSWVDVWLGPVLRSAGAGVSTAPVYYDYQLMVERDVTDHVTARVLFFGSDDRLAITINTPSPSDPALGGDISTHTGFYRAQGRVDWVLSPSVKWTNTFAGGKDFLGFALGSFFFNLDNVPLTWRSDLRAKISPEATVIVGVDQLWSSFDIGLKLPPPPAPGQAPSPFFSVPAVETHERGTLYRPAVYALLDLAPVKGLKLLPGVRADYTKDTASWNVSPRFAFRWDEHPAYPRTTIKGGAGVFFQPPQPNESIAPYGTAGLRNNRAVHYDLGFEQEFTKNVELSVDGFYKDQRNLVVQQFSNTKLSGVDYVNLGAGHVYGAEILLRYKPDDRFFGWLAYTLSRSERQDAPGQAYRLFRFDQTHILTVLGSVRLGRGWEFGARWRYVTGNLYTPYVGGVVDFDAGAYAAVSSYPLFTARVPPFHQLDLRLDKRWDFKTWKLGAYLDVQNTYYRQNPEGITYNYNYSQPQIISGLPILPIVGIRGEL